MVRIVQRINERSTKPGRCSRPSARRYAQRRGRGGPVSWRRNTRPWLPASQAARGQAVRMGTMTRQEAIDFISVGSRTGKLATASPTGKPHVAPVWFVVDGDALVFTTGEGTLKGRNLRSNPHAAVTVDVSEYPYDFVVVRGSVSLERQAPDLLAWTTRIAERYVPARLAPVYGERNAVDSELLCRLSIGRISGALAIAL